MGIPLGQGNPPLWAGVHEPPPPAIRFRRSEPPVALSLDGTVLACHHLDGKLVLYEIASGKELATLQDSKNSGPGDHFTHLAFSPDGRQLAVRTMIGQLTLWDWQSRRSKRSAFLTGSSSAMCQD